MSMLLCYENYLETSTITASSADFTSFPATNLLQGNRGKVWRSAGYFKITSANNTIVFEETAATPLTATIGEFEYTSVGAFATAVKDALDAAGASTYGVSHSTTTGKFTITSNGAGGGGIFNILWTSGSTTAEDVLGFSNAADDTGALTYTADNPRIHTEEFIVFDLGIASEPDAFIAIGKKAQAIKLTSGATIKLQGNPTDSWSSPAYDQTLTYDEIAIMQIKAEGDAGLHTSGLRYWRLSIVDRENPEGAIELSQIYLGEYYTPTVGMPQFPFSVAKQDFSEVKQLASGSKSFSRRLRSEVFSFDWLALTTAEKEIFDDMLLQVGQVDPFFVVFDQNAYFSSSDNYLCRYVRFASDPDFVLENPGQWSSGWTLEEQI